MSERGRRIRDRMQRLIPGGCHTYSKAWDQWPANCPPVLVRGRGARVYDADDTEYLSWYPGLTSVSLGHAYPAVVKAVAEQLELGNSFQLSTVIEGEAAELFLSTVAKADMVRFTKDGSTVTTAALRLARAATGRKYVAKCRQHPFLSYDDWFIGTTNCDRGCLSETAALTLDFDYDDAKSLERLFDEYPDQVAAVILEPIRFDEPDPGFFPSVRRSCDRHGAVLILDEIVTGMKYHLNGAQALLGVRPDLSCWGKGIANGFALSCLTGKRELMSLGDTAEGSGQEVFLLSTTHGAEASALAAMMATVSEFSSRDIIGDNHRHGGTLKQGLRELAAQSGLQGHVKPRGRDCLFELAFFGEDGQPWPELRTLFVQELLRERVICRGTFYPMLAHREPEIRWTLEAAEAAFRVLRRAVDDGVDRHLLSPPIRSLLR